MDQDYIKIIEDIIDGIRCPKDSNAIKRDLRIFARQKILV